MAVGTAKQKNPARLLSRAIRILTILLFFFISFTAKAQPDSTHRVHLVFNFDARYSFITGEQVHIGGMKLGLEWTRKWRSGIGIYSLSSPEITRQIHPERNSPEVVNARLKFGYFAAYAEYVLYQNKRWEFSVPLQFGLGDIHFDYLDENGKPKETHHQPISLLEPSIAGHYKIFNWIGLGAGVGYRQMLTSNGRLEHAFDSPIYYFKVKLFLGDLYRDIFKKKK